MCSLYTARQFGLGSEGFELAGRGAHYVWLLYKNGSMIVCELLSTQICGPEGL
jgi:hypothetical protein